MTAPISTTTVAQHRASSSTTAGQRRRRRSPFAAWMTTTTTTTLVILVGIAGIVAWRSSRFITPPSALSLSSSSVVVVVPTTTTTKKDGGGGLVCEAGVVYRGPAGLPPLRGRHLLGRLLEARRLTQGAEVGVQSGRHAAALLQQWNSCQSFTLVDLWAQQENYRDIANVNDARQESLFQQTKKRLEAFQNKTKFLRMLSVEAAERIPDQSLDFVYVDARHDYCGVTEDLQAYFSKLRPGGILAGHDYMDAADTKKVTPGQDWSLCLNGTVHRGAVESAVEDFAQQHGLVVSVMYAENAFFPSWMVQKPTKMECVKEMGGWGSQVVL